MIIFKKIVASVFIATLFFQHFSVAQLPKNDPAYKLVFHDEFDTTHPPFPVDDNVWSRTPPWNQKSNMTENVAWCFPGDTTPRYWDRAYIMKDRKDTTTVKVSNGTLKILTNKANYLGQVSNWPPCNPDKPGYSINNKKCKDECSVRGEDNISRCWTTETLPFKYTTGMLYSKQKFKKGFFEIRFKLPPEPPAPYKHQGFCPNFWLWGNNPPVNYYSELDVFEIIVLNGLQGDTNKFTSTVHYSDKNVHKRQKAHTESYGNKLKNDTAWHTAAAWWTDKFVKFYVDDSLYYTVQDVKEVPVEKLAEMYMIIDVNAPVDGRCNNFDEKYTQFPYVYEVDYVRVYQLK